MATQMITHGLHTDHSKQEPGMDCFVINKGLITPCRDVNNSVHFKTSVYREKKHPYICFVMTMY